MHLLRYTRLLASGCAVCAACAILAACASSGSSSSSSTPAATAASTTQSAASTTPSAASTQTAAETATQKTIAANWTAFFDPHTSTARRLALLQDSAQLAAAISASATSSTAAESSAKVVSVTVTSATQAKVVYDVLIGGTPALTNQAGTAVLESGTWKVSAASYCGLLALQAGGSTKSLPAICQTAG